VNEKLEFQRLSTPLSIFGADHPVACAIYGKLTTSSINQVGNVFVALLNACIKPFD
jgi:hypothetical protein